MEEVKKKNNGGLIITIVILIVVLILSLGYIGYDKLIKKDTKEENEIKENNDQKEELDINSDLVQELYTELTGIKWAGMLIPYSDKILYSKDLKQELKNYLGYLSITERDINSTSCRYYIDFFKEKRTNPLFCGGVNEYRAQNDPTAEIFMSNYKKEEYLEVISTSVIDADAIKKSVEKIFGKNSYENKDFNISYTVSYNYVEKTNEYILAEIPGGGMGPIPDSTLLSAKKVGNKIVLTVDSKYLYETKGENVEYTFKLEDENYIFESIKKIS